MKKHINFATTTLLLAASAFIPAIANSATVDSIDLALIENNVTEGYTRPADFDVYNASKSIGTNKRYYDSQQFDIFYVDAWLFNDEDNDGFYSSFDLAFDLDVDYGSANVYADIWIRPENGHYELLHSTDVFTIEGYGIHDEYQVSTDLYDNFPVGYYDILIELYDLNQSPYTPVATASSYYFDSLYSLPLESRSRYSNHSSLGITVSASGGSFGLILLPLASLLLLRLRRFKMRKLPFMQRNK